ncbi:MAG: 30S ribosomal protein S18 [Candidatus Binatia bacterium]
MAERSTEERPTASPGSGDQEGGRREYRERRGPRDGRPRTRGGRFRGRGRRHCIFCADKGLVIDYKRVDVLEEFVSERGKIVPRRTTGTCAKHQRPLTNAIKRARNVALLPYTETSG